MAVDLLLHSSFSPVLILGSVAVVLFIGFVCFSSNSGPKEPPGPRPLPLLGNLLQLDLKDLPGSLWKLSERFGPVLRVWVGSEQWLVLVGFEAVKEALVDHSEVFGGRAAPVIMEETVRGHGITWSNGETSQEMRSLFMSVLKDLEEKVTEESRHLLQDLKTLNGEAFETFQRLNFAASNVVCSLVYGSRFNYSDSHFSSMIQRLYERTLLSGTTSVKLYNLFPWTGVFVSNRAKIQRIIEDFRAENERLVCALRESVQPHQCRGFVDAFILRQTQLQESGLTDGVFTDENLMHSVMSLLVGTQSSATVMSWQLLLMAKYNNIQDQVREEIFRVIGSRQVQTEDRRDLPFTDAVIHETLRFANFAPMGISRRTTRDVTFRGIFIKEGTLVWPHLSSILFDQSYWEKPHTFYPQHFLHQDGKFRKRDAFMPFSAGFRVCPGKGLAHIELFIFFVTLLQHFRFTPPPGVTELDVTPTTGLIVRPRPHRLCAVALDRPEV